MLNRRELLKISALAAFPVSAAEKKKIATVITEYRLNSHADVIVGRLLEGYEYNSDKRTPRVQVVSMYTDQKPDNDMSRAMSSKHGFPIFSTVREALTLGQGKLAVEGVVLIGEHGKYPDNEKGQKLYPRYELYKQIVDTFREFKQAVPVFTDKHLSVEWKNAKWMYDQSRELGFPLMAGSSLPVAWRKPELELDLETPVERAVCCFYGGKESYGFHALEALECMVERRKGGETGIKSVQCLERSDVWRWTDANAWAGRLFEAALERSETRKPGSPRELVKEPILFLLDYRSGLRAAVFLLNGCLQDCTLAFDIAGHPRPLSTEIWLQSGRPYSHFSGLSFFIENMIVTGHAPYPVERTLLTTGALAALMDSSFRGGSPLETPHLDVVYRAPKQSFYNRGAVPALEKS